ncbi:Chromosomal replication initiator protein DnaA [uncultured archaeon]|nr:Chromosomal replication initiator protein DnaA [uncultured archaeon]
MGQFTFNRVVGIVHTLASDPALSVDNLLEKLCAGTGFSPKDLLGRSKSQSVASLRQGAYYLLHEKLGLSHPETARFMGRKDHTTSLYGVRKISGGLEAYAH